MTMSRVAFHTLGCKVNYAETSTISRQFIARGFTIVAADQPCDVFVLNTCSVTHRADRECRQTVRRILRRSPTAYVIVVGCYSQLQPSEISSIEGVDLVLGAREKFRVFDIVEGFSKRNLPQVFVSCIDDPIEFEAAVSGENDGRTRSFLKIQDGCEYNCAFCTIPLARGRSRSQDLGEVLHQASSLVGKGFKEIVLTGVNVGDYGGTAGTPFLELLRALDNVKGLERIRVSSIEPNLLTRETVDFILRSGKFCRHFHIPLQSGSDAILKRMHRRYLTREFRELIEYIKGQDTDAGIGVDVIAGFPGETDRLFHETCLFLAELPVSYCHVFTYSERPNTPADMFSGSVEPRIRASRSEMLHILADKKRRSFYSSFIGRTLPVLFETRSFDYRVSGLTSNYIRAEITSDVDLTNNIRNVRIVGLGDDCCLGELEGTNDKELISKPRLFDDVQLHARE